jgi:hypothetical protein
MQGGCRSLQTKKRAWVQALHQTHWSVMQREAKENGGLGSSHTAPCGAAVPARPPTRSSETTHLHCTPQWVRRATGRGTRVVVQTAFFPGLSGDRRSSKLCNYNEICQRTSTNSSIVTPNSTTPLQPQFHLSFAPSALPVLDEVEFASVSDRRQGNHAVYCFAVFSEGGAGERVQGARAAYGTCFAYLDIQTRPNIPAFSAHQPFGGLVTSKGGTGNKILPQAVPVYEWF